MKRVVLVVQPFTRRRERASIVAGIRRRSPPNRSGTHRDELSLDGRIGNHVSQVPVGYGAERRICYERKSMAELELCLGYDVAAEAGYPCGSMPEIRST